MPSTHIPVMPAEVFERLQLKCGDVYVDCTAGLGGHAAIAAGLVGASGRIVLNDVDPQNLERATEKVRAAGVAAEALRGNFADIGRRLAAAGIRVDGVLADLGFSSNQMDEGVKGLSFMREGPLDMRLDPSLPISAADLVNGSSESELASLIREFGEEPFAGRIARKLVQIRTTSPISTTLQLADAVRSAVPGGRTSGIDPATKTFQALRITVNDELGCLGAFLKSIEDAAAGRLGWMNPGCRVCVIAFHSLEDRMVKRSFGGLVKSGLAVEVGEQGVGPGDEEVGRNPRSRSAKMRAIEIGKV
jgi:16S rRNA (cytosine1402-N4)-methyltransferase